MGRRCFKLVASIQGRHGSCRPLSSDSQRIEGAGVALVTETNRLDGEAGRQENQHVRAESVLIFTHLWLDTAPQGDSKESTAYV